MKQIKAGETYTLRCGYKARVWEIVDGVWDYPVIGSYVVPTTGQTIATMWKLNGESYTSAPLNIVLEAPKMRLYRATHDLRREFGFIKRGTVVARIEGDEPATSDWELITL